jgi:hypothetical protein
METVPVLSRSRIEVSSSATRATPFTAGSVIVIGVRAATGFFTRTGFNSRTAAAMAAMCSGRVP